MLAFALAAFLSLAPTPATTIEKSGGIAGVQERLVVAAGGRTARYTQQRNVPARTVTLTAGERTALRAALHTADLATPLKPYAGGCADCFEYDIRSGGHQAHISEDQVPRRFGPLLAFFGRVSRRLSGTAGTG